jgi:hypothetical protein
MSYLYAAYIATWAIHIAYVVFLVRGIARLRAEAAELEREHK